MKFETAITSHGYMLFYTDDEKIETYKNEFETRTWEKEVARYILNNHFYKFIDVGAEFGFYSLMARINAKEIIAFEPHPLRYGILAWNLREINKATAIQASVGGMSYLDASHPTNMNTTFGGNNVIPSKAPVVWLNNYVDMETRTLIKVDVEGMELDVIYSLGGMTEDYPNITWIVEYHDGWKHMNVGANDVKDYFPMHKCTEIGNRSHLLFEMEETF